MCALSLPALRRARPGLGAVVPLVGCGLPLSALAAGLPTQPGLTGLQVSALVCALLGGLAMRSWWRGRDEPASLVFAAVALLGALHGLLDAVGGAGGAAWAQAGTGWMLALTGFLAWRLGGVPPPRAAQALLVCAAIASVLALPVWPRVPGLLHTLVLAGMAGALALLISLDTRRRGRPELTASGWAAWATLALGLHDLWHPGGLLPYAPLLWSGVYLHAVQRRCQAALLAGEQALAKHRAEPPVPATLPEAPPSWREAERQQAVLRERQRLMRDLHDGAGSALMSALVLVEQGQLDARAVADLLRECMDDIRLVIDSMEPVDHDLVALLASLRYRLGRRMELSGVSLAWRVQDVPALAWMDAGAALQILRIVQESLANVLKHAQAQSVVLGVALHHDGERHWVRVTIADDGCGFDLARLDGAPPGGRGLHNLRSRARALQGRLAIRSQPGGTEITLDLPVHAGPTGPAPDAARACLALSDVAAWD